MIRGQRKSAEPETLLQESLATQRKLLGNDHPAVAISLEQLAGVRRDQGKLEEAETLVKECLDIREKRIPDDWSHIRRPECLGGGSAGAQEVRRGRAVADLRLQRPPKSARPGFPPPVSVSLKEAVERLVRLYEETARPDKAAEWKQKLAELMKPAPDAKLGAETKDK